MKCRVLPINVSHWSPRGYYILLKHLKSLSLEQLKGVMLEVIFDPPPPLLHTEGYVEIGIETPDKNHHEGKHLNFGQSK